MEGSSLSVRTLVESVADSSFLLSFAGFDGQCQLDGSLFLLPRSAPSHHADPILELQALNLTTQVRSIAVV